MLARLLPLALLLVAGMACISGRPSRAESEAAPVSSTTTLTLGTSAWGTAVIGSCERCGRSVYSPATSSNFLVRVHARDSAFVWSGCLDCLVDILRKNR